MAREWLRRSHHFWRNHPGPCPWRGEKGKITVYPSADAGQPHCPQTSGQGGGLVIKGAGTRNARVDRALGAKEAGSKRCLGDSGSPAPGEATVTRVLLWEGGIPTRRWQREPDSVLLCLAHFLLFTRANTSQPPLQLGLSRRPDSGGQAVGESPSGNCWLRKKGFAPSLPSCLESGFVAGAAAATLYQGGDVHGAKPLREGRTDQGAWIAQLSPAPASRPRAAPAGQGCLGQESL